nr:leucine-rich repeat receptor-like serine/threonine/tyrosine-protein kinase SOBIR1 [Ziziphus jujuba var. spinosa]
MRISKTRHGKTVENDQIMKEIQTILGYDGSDQGWMMLCRGAAEMARATGKLAVSTLNEFNSWQSKALELGLVPAIVDELKRRRTREHCNHLVMPGNLDVSGTVICADCSREMEKEKDNKKKLIWWLLGSMAGTISGFTFSRLFKPILAAVMCGGKDKGPAIFSPLIKKKEDLAFLKNKERITSLEKIREGSLGEVYKAELPGSNGKMISIKKIIQPHMSTAELTQQDSKTLNKKMHQIRSEINIVGHIRHPNLLPLLAHVPRPDCHYLVYEFMKNGSLQDRFGNVKQGTQELDWLARVKIAQGVASGLEYLHMNQNPRIIHRNLMPANILLDDDMEARIADFGLAKAMPDAHTHMTSSNIVGTVGYIAPEFHQTLKFTDKCDIYSFGVVLAVLVTGKLPSDEFFQNGNEIGLVKWLRSVTNSENPRQAIDSKLIGNGFEEQMLLVLKVAYFCTLDNPKERPNSKDVRCMLSQIKH